MVPGSPPEDVAAVDEQDPVAAALKLAMHEIRQPLAAVFALAEAALSRPHVPADVRRCLDQIIEQAQEISDAAGSVLDHRSRAGIAEAGPVDVDEVVDSVLSGFRRTWSGTLSRRGQRGGIAVTGDRVTVRRCLVNVLDNAVRAAGPSGTVTVTVHRGTDVVRILVEDDGPGFGHVPSGSGLGLPVTRRELEAMGGSLAAGLSSRGGGGRVALSLPAWTVGRGAGSGRGRAG